MAGNAPHAVRPPAAGPSAATRGSGPDGASPADHRPGVILPTTSAPIIVESLKRRRRLPASYVALKGDFRPLQISTDYDRFVRGPLQAILGELVSFELVLDGDIDCGRSWELPVLIAHWLGEAEPAGDREARPSPLLWATGMVDADLNPLPADYEVPRKIAACAEAFADWRALFGAIVAILPHATGPEEEADIRALFSDHGIAVHFIADFAELDAVLARETGRVLQGRPAAPGPAAEDPAPAPEPASPPAPRRTSARTSARSLAVASVAAAGLLVLVLPIFPFGSVVSTLLGDPGDIEDPPRVAVEPALTLGGLYAEDRTECIAKFFSGEPLDSRSATMTIDGFSLQTETALCGLRFRNMGAGTIEVTLDADLIGRGIAGSTSLVSPMVLAPGQERDLYFARPPGVMTAAAQVSEPGVPDRHWMIQLQ